MNDKHFHSFVPCCGKRLGEYWQESNTGSKPKYLSPSTPGDELIYGVFIMFPFSTLDFAENATKFTSLHRLLFVNIFSFQQIFQNFCVPGGN
jgi:hypothetical protein